MKILTNYSYLKTYLDFHEKSIQHIPEILDAAQLDGYEIADRSLINLSKSDRLLMAKTAVENGLEIVTDINVDITYRNSTRLKQQIFHAVNQIEIANQMHARRVRICLGGQTISMQKLWAFRFQSNRSPVCHVSKVNAKSRLFSLFKSRIGYLAHGIRKNTKARVWRREDKIELAIKALKKILPTSEKMGIRIGIENHWGVSSRPEWIINVVDRVNSSFLGTCPDFGNWPKDVMSDNGIAILAPKAIIAHIKSVNPRRNVWKQFESIIRKVDILINHCFSGPFTLENEGMVDPWNSILLTARLLRQHYR